MSNRYNGRDTDEIQNTDNEDTVLLPNDLEGYSSPKSDLPPLRKVNRRGTAQSQQPQAPGYQSTGAPPQFPKTGQPPQFPQTTPPPQQQFDYSDRRYYDYERQSPQGYGTNNSGGGGYAPPPPPAAPAAPRPQPSGGKKPAAPHHEEEAPRKKKKKRRHKSLVGKIIRRIIHIILILFLLLFGIYSCTSVCLIKQVNKVPEGHRNHYADSVGKGYVKNILVLGTDGRTADDRGRSDSMILVSLNRKTNEIIMTSFMRDSYVEIPDNGWNKLNAAYAFGGPELLMETIQHNFDIPVSRYVLVNFEAFAGVVDAVGGVDIELTTEEIGWVNAYLNEYNELTGHEFGYNYLTQTEPGVIHLNGPQALAYSRNRYVGTDFGRTERQRKVISGAVSKVKHGHFISGYNLATKAAPSITTDIKTWGMLRVAFGIMTGGEMKSHIIPVEGTYYGDSINGMSVLVPDIEKNKEYLQRYINGEE